VAGGVVGQVVGTGPGRSSECIIAPISRSIRWRVTGEAVIAASVPSGATATATVRGSPPTMSRAVPVSGSMAETRPPSSMNRGA